MKGKVMGRLHENFILEDTLGRNWHQKYNFKIDNQQIKYMNFQYKIITNIKTNKS